MENSCDILYRKTVRARPYTIRADHAVLRADHAALQHGYRPGLSVTQLKR